VHDPYGDDAVHSLEHREALHAQQFGCPNSVAYLAHTCTANEGYKERHRLTVSHFFDGQC
jgi:hypothetical protein